MVFLTFVSHFDLLVIELKTIGELRFLTKLFLVLVEGVARHKGCTDSVYKRAAFSFLLSKVRTKMLASSRMSNKLDILNVNSTYAEEEGKITFC